MRELTTGKKEDDSAKAAARAADIANKRAVIATLQDQKTPVQRGLDTAKAALERNPGNAACQRDVETAQREMNQINHNIGAVQQAPDNLLRQD